MILLMIIMMLLVILVNHVFLLGGFLDSVLPSTHYSSNEFVLLTDGEEPECYKEAMKNEHKKKFVQELIFQQ